MQGQVSASDPVLDLPLQSLIVFLVLLAAQCSTAQRAQRGTPESYSTTTSAVYRLMPSPPARVDSRKMNLSLPSRL